MRGFIQLMIVLFATAWILHGFALLSGLISKVKVNSAVGGSGVFLVVFFLGGPLIAGGIFSTQLVEQADRLTFYGISLPWLAVVLLYEIAVLFFVFLATRRRMESDRIHPLSKPQAIAALATLAVLALGGIWGLDEFDLIGDWLSLRLSRDLDLAPPDGHAQSGRLSEGPVASAEARTDRFVGLGRSGA